MLLWLPSAKLNGKARLVNGYACTMELFYLEFVFGLSCQLEMDENIMCINNKMVQEWICKLHQRGYDSTRGEEERGAMGDQILASMCQHQKSPKIMSCALNKPIISFFYYFTIIECMCWVGGKSHLMLLLKYGTGYTFVIVFSVVRSQSVASKSPSFYCHKLH